MLFSVCIYVALDIAVSHQGRYFCTQNALCVVKERKSVREIEQAENKTDKYEKY